jgi:hypothetical protein
MIFYKNVLISTILSAIILIAIVGGIMFYFKNKEIYPPVIDACPDYYNLDASTNMCMRTSALGDPPSTSSGCMSINFSDQSYLLPGSSVGSGICNKRDKATYCGATWDGITNNFSIC